jgi:branched-chain amino acid transport system ATP-binding protein
MSVLLQTTGLYKHFGGVVATDRVDLDVAAGELHALIGPNGAGKTTLIAQLSGLLAPDEGRILLGGEDITRFPAYARVKRGLARSFQVTSVFPRLSVIDNLALAVQARSGTSFSFWRPRDSEHAIFEEAAAIARQVGLAGRVRSLASSLAHGEQRQLELGLALATRPKLLLLDEPMAGMGVEESARLVELIAHLKTRLTILLVEHDMDAVFRLADRISVLVSGRLIASGSPDAIRADASVRKAYLGEEVPA